MQSEKQESERVCPHTRLKEPILQRTIEKQGAYLHKSKGSRQSLREWTSGFRLKKKDVSGWKGLYEITDWEFYLYFTILVF